MTAPKIYLSNKELLKEIHKSKMTYSWLKAPEYFQYDIIVRDLNDFNDTPTEKFPNGVIAEAKANRASVLSVKAHEAALKEWEEVRNSKGEKPKAIQHKVDPETINADDLVIRLMTFGHIPEEPGRKNKPKITSDYHSKVNFPPYKHFAKINGAWEEVARSHWKGDLATGSFSVDHGQTTRGLAQMYIKLCERYSMRSNWRGYTYVEEMRGQALLQLSQIGLQFDESKSENPFAYYTAAITNSFTRILNIEKKNQVIRDDLLIDSGQLPSYTRQLEYEALMSQERERNNALREAEEAVAEATEGETEAAEGEVND
jgi:hypothetical protein